MPRIRRLFQDRFATASGLICLLCAHLIAILCAELTAAETQRVTLEFAISSGDDDAEESAGGDVSLDSSDLELVTDGNRGAQLVGLRFRNIGLPSDAFFHQAYVQFTVDETASTETALTLSAEATDDAAPFTTRLGDLGDRSQGSHAVEWSPPPWGTVGARNEEQRSPDLSQILEEVVQREGWQPGNAIALFIHGSGQRVAEAFDGESASAARLIVDVELPVSTGATAPLFLNEVSATYHTVQDEEGDYDDWIELYHDGTRSLNLAGFYLTDTLDDLTKWPLPANRSIGARDFLIVWADGETDEGDLHAGFKLKGSGDDLALVQNVGGTLTVIDYVRFGDQSYRASYGRATPGDGPFVPFGSATPGEDNDLNQLWQEPPRFSPGSGDYDEPQTISLAASDGAEIRYTTDGSEPTSSSRRYDGPFEVRSTRGIRARAYRPGYAPSIVVTEAYLIDEERSLPAVYLATDPDNLWDDEIGIYVAGTNGRTGNCSEEPRNWNQPWERPAHVTFIELDGRVAFDTNVGISIAGGCTRRKALKSLNVAAKSRYGSTNIRYRLYPDSEQTEFKRFKLRNSGNDWNNTFFRDGFLQNLVRGEIDLELQRHRPVVVYLNGEYWGIHNIRDVYSEHYLGYKYPTIEKDKLDILKEWRSRRTVEGTRDSYNELAAFIESSDLSDDAEFAEVEAQVDLLQFINYQALEVFVGNHDWPGNNVKFWREQREGGRWRWMAFDLDNGFGRGRQKDPAYNSLEPALEPNGNEYPNPPESTLFFRKFLENDGFRAEFLQTFATHLNLVYTEERIRSISDEMAAAIEDEMPRHIDRWRDFEGISSMSSWRSRISEMQRYGAARPPHVRDHLMSELGVDGTYRLSISHAAADGGNVYLNAAGYPAPDDYSGIYFRNVPLRLRAEARPGYRFLHWEETGETEPEIEIRSRDDTTLTPVFSRTVENGALASAATLTLTEVHYHPIDGGALRVPGIPERLRRAHRPPRRSRLRSGRVCLPGGRDS